MKKRILLYCLLIAAVSSPAHSRQPPANGETVTLVQKPLLLGCPPRVLNVTKTEDEIDDAGCTLDDCSLREAILSAQEPDPICRSKTPTINIPSGLYPLTLAPLDWNVQNGLAGSLVIGKPMILRGSGAGSTVIDGQNLHQVFRINLSNSEFKETVLISDLSVQNGGTSRNPDASGCGISHESHENAKLMLKNVEVLSNCKQFLLTAGCGIANLSGSLEMENGNVHDHTCRAPGAGIANGDRLLIKNSVIARNQNIGAEFPAGGGIYSWGTIEMTNSRVEGNQSGFSGGMQLADGGTARIVKSLITKNKAIEAGGVLNHGDLEIIDSTFSFNKADDFQKACGGGLRHQLGSLNIERSFFFSNESANLGGGICNTSPEGTAEVFKTVFARNQANNGGALTHVTGVMNLEQVTLSSNRAGNGGGLENYATLLITQDSVISDNTADNGLGGGIYNVGDLIIEENTSIIANKANLLGGGIYNAWLDTDMPGRLTLTRSSIKSNKSSQGAGIFNAGNLSLVEASLEENIASLRGGGLLSRISAPSGNNVDISRSTFKLNEAPIGGGIFNSAGKLFLFNSTLSGNKADTAGGGLYNENAAIASGRWGLTAEASLVHVTVTNNSSNQSFGGIANEDTLILKSSLIAQNQDAKGDPDCGNSFLLRVVDDKSRFQSQGYNFIGEMNNADCALKGTGDMLGQKGAVLDAKLDILKVDAFFTETHNPKSDSPAINAADCLDRDNNPITIDQRGLQRPYWFPKKPGEILMPGVLQCDMGAIETRCGDGIKDPYEFCDDGLNNGKQGFCKTTCQR